jgi:hypothetical protein
MATVSMQSPSAACFIAGVCCSEDSRQMRDYLRDLVLEIEFVSPSPG